jgi:hypothetical protein
LCETPLRLVRLSAEADPVETDLLAARSLAYGADLSAYAPKVAPDGTVRFVLRQVGDAAYRGNGLASIRPDGSEWTQRAPLPPEPPSEPDDLAFAYAVWAADASQLLLFPVDPRFATEPAQRQAYLMDGAVDRVLDVTPAVAGGSWFVFAGP